MFSRRGVSAALVGIVVAIVVGIVVAGVYVLKPAKKEVAPAAPMAVESVSTGMSSKPGTSATVEATVRNVGEERGSSTFNLKCEGEVVDSKSIALDPGETGTLSFSVTKDEAGTYDVSVREKTATLRFSPVIRIIKGNWPMARPGAFILAFALNKMGYRTEVSETSIAIAHKTLVEKDADLYPGCWMPSYEWVFESVPGSEELPVIGVNRKSHDAGIAVPGYVYDNMKADLGRKPRLKDLPRYGEEFDYRITACAPGYSTTMWSKQLTENMLGGEWETFVAGSTIAANAEMKSAVRNREWEALAYWDPTYLWIILPNMKYLENPTPESGEYQFGFKGKGQILTIARKGFTEDFPREVVRLAKAFTLQKEFGKPGARERYGLWLAKEDISAKRAARRWVETHMDRVKSWIEAAKGTKELGWPPKPYPPLKKWAENPFRQKALS